MQNSISLPNKVYFTIDEKFKSQIVIEPLYPGYGMTIGNALRRVLLSSLPGAAVTAVKIKGVDHEFSTVPNVTEDVVDLVLNLKQLRLKLDAEEPVRLELKSKGQKTVTAKDIKPDSRVEIINPELEIATLDSKNAELVMEIIVERGRGYVPVEQRESEKQEIGMIAVDAIFTPVRNVNFEVENVRVGQITNYDKLTLHMETDGTISGREAIDIASQILVDHFSLLETSRMAEAEQQAVVVTAAAGQETLKEKESEAQRIAPILAQDEKIDEIANLGLSNRAHNALLKNNVRTIAALKKLGREQLLAMEGLGVKSIEEIMKLLENLP